ncbi:molybdenum cofactor biosynthesis protein [Luteimicrobium album]|uniref:Molybdenum cofactor biosynthesis protein n=1 Tax=Luteimicrobium album TaxID=1054550 RepID=A0ABQ6I8Q8_9MICO|nr:MOSC N-terminal beta barrel domain-containing protein [Luteimicrobium album]GMA26582.1 molybdenum cofactor biosynthesis protein [Luteimicrobium album]
MRVASLHVYPVKGCHRIDLDEAVVEPWGLAGDRRWLTVDADGKLVSQREVRALATVRPRLTGAGVRLSAPGLEDLDVGAVPGPPVEADVWGNRFQATSCGPEADAWLSRVAGRELRLVWMDDPTRRPVEQGWSQPGDVVSAADGYPLLLASASSLDALNGWIAAESSPDEVVPMTRFRPNVVVEGAPAWAEDAWTGRRLRVGDVVLRVANPCARCVMTTTDQESGSVAASPCARWRGTATSTSSSCSPSTPSRTAPACCAWATRSRSWTDAPDVAQPCARRAAWAATLRCIPPKTMPWNGLTDHQ